MKVAFHTLGCKVNQYETEAMSSAFKKRGYEVVDEKDFADAYIINTCTVTAIADKKSRQYIRRMKRVNPNSIIAVTGCYVQVSPEEVQSIKEVDIVAGMGEKKEIIDLVDQAVKKRAQLEELTMRKPHLETSCDFMEMGPVESREDRTRAYIKIQEGCNRYCSYCVIPYARGESRSRPLENIVDECKRLLDRGYKEIVLTGINTALYGMEKKENAFGLEDVIREIDALEGDFRIRLSSLEPAVVNADYVKSLFKYDKLCHHLHMSAQSGSDDVLAAMNRPYDSEEYLRLATTLFDFDMCYGISTDIIVGFPGEKESDFYDTCDLVHDCSFCKTHIFKYSKRPFTKAAEMKGHVSPKVKKERADILEKIALNSAMDFFKLNIRAAEEGRLERVLLEEEVDVLIDGMKTRCFTGYTGNYIKTYIPAVDGMEANTFVDVRLKDILKDGMMGEAVL